MIRKRCAFRLDLVFDRTYQATTSLPSNNCVTKQQLSFKAAISNPNGSLSSPTIMSLS